jgi:hypothetical protein
LVYLTLNEANMHILLSARSKKSDSRVPTYRRRQVENSEARSNATDFVVYIKTATPQSEESKKRHKN